MALGAGDGGVRHQARPWPTTRAWPRSTPRRAPRCATSTTRRSTSGAPSHATRRGRTTRTRPPLSAELLKLAEAVHCVMRPSNGHSAWSTGSTLEPSNRLVDCTSRRRHFGWLTACWRSINMLSWSCLVDRAGGGVAGAHLQRVVALFLAAIRPTGRTRPSVFLIVGAVFMSAAAIQAQRGHVAIEALAGLCSPRGEPDPRAHRRYRELGCSAASSPGSPGRCCTKRSTENYHSGSTWGPPLWIPYSLMSVGMTLLTMQLLLQIVARASARGTARHERAVASGCCTAGRRCW